MRPKEFYEGLVGKRYNSLTIERFLGFRSESKTHPTHKRGYYLCRCECGNPKEAMLPHLVRENVKSCGCKKQGRFNANWEGCGEIGRTQWNRYVRGAEERGLSLEITIEQAWDLYRIQDGKCALSGIEIGFNTQPRKSTASLDRIDSSKGYVEGNVQWVHKDVNMMKRDFPDAYFIEVCKKIASHNEP